MPNRLEEFGPRARRGEAGMSSAAPQLTLYLALAESIFAEIERLAAGAGAFLRSGYQTSERDRVMVALACKADGSFRALIEDCRAGRGEAMHHLKTMAEIFIYFYAVVADDTDKTANAIIAECVGEQHARRHRRLAPGSPEQLDWEQFRDEFRRESAKISDLARLAEQHGTALWYARVYQLACESAHLGDLLEWMPGDDWKLLVGETAVAKTGPWKLKLAISYGIEIALGLLDTITQINIAGLQVDTSVFRAELAAIRETRTT
jgi:hypothetical protein